MEITNLKELNSFAKQKLTAWKKESKNVIGLSGDLGSGKTAFVKELAKHLGIQKDIVSPTFVIMKSYQTKDDTYKTLTHIDAYRLKDKSELSHIDWDHIKDIKDNLILIEWPEQVDLVDIPTIHFTYIDESKRHIKDNTLTD